MDLKGNHFQVDEMDIVFWEKQHYNSQSFEWNDVSNEKVIRKWLFLTFQIYIYLRLILIRIRTK